MKHFTEFELQQFEGYDVLKRILNPAEIQFFYNQPTTTRAKALTNKTLIRSVRGVSNTAVAPESIIAPNKPLGTQKCLTMVDKIKNMALGYMSKDFTVNGRIYNMNKCHWKFEFNNRKRALGLCSPRNRTIYLSNWVIQNSNNTFETWEQTMLHEIAHAIDVENRGRSDHSWIWLNIARQIGYKGGREAKIDYKEDTVSKYTIVCDKCGYTHPSHKRSRKIEEGRVSCGNGFFDKNKLLRQVRNY